MKRREFLKSSFKLSVGGILLPTLLLTRKSMAGSATIIDLSGDLQISLLKGSFARTFDVGTWSKLRMGLRVAWNGSANIAGQPRCAIGFSSGTSAQVLDTDGSTASTGPTNWIGVLSETSTWTYSDNAGYKYFNAIQFKHYSRHGSTWNAATNYGDTMPSAVQTVYKVWAIEIDKNGGTTNWKIIQFFPNINANTSLTQSEFCSMIAGPHKGLSYTNHSYDNEEALSAFDQAYGTIDSVNIAWNNSGTEMHISDVVLVKLAS